MTDELRNQAWVSLPEDFKKEVREIYHNGLTPLSILRPFEKSRVTECESLYRINILHKSGSVAHIHGSSPRAVYAALIDKIAGKGVWESNPWVFVYDFELVK